MLWSHRSPGEPGEQPHQAAAVDTDENEEKKGHVCKKRQWGRQEVANFTSCIGMESSKEGWGWAGEGSGAASGLGGSRTQLIVHCCHEGK